MKSENFKSVMTRVNDYLAREIFPGCEFGIIEGEQTERFCLGKAAILPRLEDLEPGKLWDLASVTKVVGVGTLMINRVLAGKLDLSARLQSKYSQWYEDTVTLGQLLTHTSGINPYIENRDQLDFVGLVDAMNHLQVTPNKNFHYTDVNFILLGLMLEQLEGCSLAELIDQEILQPWQMNETSYGPVENAVPTAYQLSTGVVHDPKAGVLGRHCGSAGLFSSLTDLTKFVQAYFADGKYLQLLHNFSTDAQHPRSLAWDLLPDNWLLHTGYTGTFILMNLPKKQAVVFLSNRVHLKDKRKQWIIDRNILIQDFIKALEA